MSEHRINYCLDRFRNICGELRFTLTAQISTSMLFGRYTLENRRLIFKLLGNSISIKDTITYQGFFLNSRFNWMEHLDNLHNKIQNFDINLRNAGCRERGLKKDCLKKPGISQLLRSKYPMGTKCGMGIVGSQVSKDIKERKFFPEGRTIACSPGLPIDIYRCPFWGHEHSRIINSS